MQPGPAQVGIIISFSRRNTPAFYIHRIIMPHRCLLLVILGLWITNTVLVNRKQGITLGETRAVVDFADSRLPPALLQTESGGTGMSNNIAADRFLGVGVIHGAGTTVDLCNHLVRDDDGNAKLVGQSLQCPQKLGHVRLAR